jgi:hypothetical protein
MIFLDHRSVALKGFKVLGSSIRPILRDSELLSVPGVVGNAGD